MHQFLNNFIYVREKGYCKKGLLSKSSGYQNITFSKDIVITLDNGSAIINLIRCNTALGWHRHNVGIGTAAV